MKRIPVYITLCLTLSACDTLSQSSTDALIISAAVEAQKEAATRSPLIRDILASRPSESSKQPFTVGQPRDVSDIVAKYIPIGTPKHEVKQILKQMNQSFKENGNQIQIGYLAPFVPMVPHANTQIRLNFNEQEQLEQINAQIYYQQ